jgi:hypothetical protein
MAFHPQTDSLSEHKNQWVEQYLHLVTSAVPKDWTQWLTLATAVHNNRRNETTKLSPNQILLGYNTVLDPGVTPLSNNKIAKERVRIMIEHWKQAIKALNQVVEKHGKPLAQYNTGDQVWLEGKYLQLPYQSTKLAPKRYGPFKIIKEISPVAYQLVLPPTWSIHNVFHASLLLPYSEMSTHGPNFSWPPPDLIDSEMEYEVEQICNHWQFGYNQTLKYLIKWKGYPKSDNMWEKAQDIHTPELVKAYHWATPLEVIKRASLNKKGNASQAGSHSSFTTSLLPLEHSCLSPFCPKRPLPSYQHPHHRALNLLP